jgi:hypothetical protein
MGTRKIIPTSTHTRTIIAVFNGGLSLKLNEGLSRRVLNFSWNEFII